MNWEVIIIQILSLSYFYHLGYDSGFLDGHRKGMDAMEKHLKEKGKIK